jgi:hypothetical protein
MGRTPRRYWLEERSAPKLTAMKNNIFNLTAASALALALTGAGGTALGQASVQTITEAPVAVQSTTTTSAGTISEFNPDSIVVKTEAAEPVHYNYSKSTTYVDEDGNAVSMETVKSGLPVTVYYVRDGDNLVASKVIVRKSTITPAIRVDASKTTTTTTTDK